MSMTLIQQHNRPNPTHGTSRIKLTILIHKLKQLKTHKREVRL